MKNFDKILEIVRTDGGKAFITSPEGDIDLVVMTIEEYLRLGKKDDRYGRLSAKLSDLAAQAEDLNREISMAQMDDQDLGEGAADNDEEISDTVYIEPISEEETA